MKRILVTPLDWGLGHATRCIPVIELLLKKNYEVMVASSGSVLLLLKMEFPDLRFFKLPSYGIKYPSSGSFVFSMVKQIPKIRRVIAKENRRVRKIVKENNVDLIVSDNRYGCWSSNIPSVFICHQLNIQLPGAWRVFKPLVDMFHNRAIRKFNQCWIPDDPELNLTGELSIHEKFNTKRIGILSRFKKTNSEQKFDIAVVLSGPEPQRSIFENVILKQIRNQNLKSIVVRGVVEGEGNRKEEGNVTIMNFLGSDKLEEIINQSKLVIARSGYSTIMDLARLGKKAIFVPTPGQTEQEYLGAKLMKERIALCVDQREFDLSIALRISNDFTGFSNIEKNEKLLEEALEGTLK